MGISQMVLLSAWVLSDSEIDKVSEVELAKLSVSVS